MGCLLNIWTTACQVVQAMSQLGVTPESLFILSFFLSTTIFIVYKRMNFRVSDLRRSSVCSSLLHSEVTTGSDNYLRCSYIAINTFARYPTMVMKRCGDTNVYLIPLFYLVTLSSCLTEKVILLVTHSLLCNKYLAWARRFRRSAWS